jgi:hypothetical protein
MISLTRQVDHRVLPLVRAATPAIDAGVDSSR